MWIKKKKYLDQTEHVRKYYADKNSKLQVENTALKKELEQLKFDISLLKNEQVSPQKVVASILKKDVTWFDFEELDPAQQSAYFQDAQLILNNNVFNNEINFLFAEWMKWAVKEAPGFAEIRDIRVSMNAIEMLKKRLETICIPKTGASISEKIYEAI